MKHIVLSPHLDDAVLSLGGLLGLYGTDATVITFFAGTPSPRRMTAWDVLCGFLQSDKAMEARTNEDAAALRLLGVDRIIRLSYMDTQYRKGRLTAAELSEALDAELESYDFNTDEEVRIYGPGLETHPDHALVKAALVQHAQTHAGKYRCFFYQDIPYALFKTRWGRKPFMPLDEFRRDRAHPIELSEEDMDLKMAAIHTYASQLRALGGTRMLGYGIRSLARRQADAFGLQADYAEVVYEC